MITSKNNAKAYRFIFLQGISNLFKKQVLTMLKLIFATLTPYIQLNAVVQLSPYTEKNQIHICICHNYSSPI
ncbi:hypothetical protein F7N03_16875 [Escherichia coli]|nr:hypothetical protein [Salmonella enterica]EFE7683724.1 hypothetical protein [Escherichia coli]MCE4178453.1 hypothetical protein [Escherichia coli]MCE4180142.1 hypothetical protein [Escherichia coli]MCE4230780.1 hypothetical protein [Escherichia coli]